MKRKAENQEQKKINKKESELVTKESFSAVCALFSFIALLILCTRALVFGELGLAVHAFLVGLLGYTAYPLLLAGLYLSVTSLLGKRFVKSRKAGGCIALAIVCICLTVHTATTFSWFAEEGYLARCFYAGEAFPAATACGWVGGIFAYLFATVTSAVGAIIVFSALGLFFAYLAYVVLKKRKEGKEGAMAEQSENGNGNGNVNRASAPMQTAFPAPVEIPTSEVGATASSAPYFSGETNTNETQRNRYDVETSQSPRVRLGGETEQSSSPASGGVGTAFSPFGTPQAMRSEEELKSSGYENSREFLFSGTPAENYQRNLIFDPNARVNRRAAVDPNANPSVAAGYTPSYTEAYQNTVNENTTPERPVKIFTNRADDYSERSYGGYSAEREPALGDPYRLQTEEPARPIEPMRPIEPEQITPQETLSYREEEPTFQEETDLDGQTLDRGEAGRRHDYMDLFSPSNPNVFGSDGADRALAQETFQTRAEETLDDLDDEFEALEKGRVEEEETFSRRGEDFSTREGLRFNEDEGRERLGRDFFKEDDEEEEDTDEYTLRNTFEEERGRLDGFERENERGRGFFDEEKLTPPSDAYVSPAPVERKEVAPPPPLKPRVIRPYVRVPLDDFDCRDVQPMENFEETQEIKETIIATLEECGVSGATIASVSHGPTVTRYNVVLPRSILPQKVVSREQAIALSLHSKVNIYPNYEDGAVSIEVPNKQRQFVQLGCMLTGDTFVNAKESSLMFAMGKDIGNRKVYGDISKMIHLLVAGSSGSGKSVFLGSLIVSLIYKYSPEQLRLILIDPKKTEFVLYNNLPHLMINEIITDANKAVQSLNWAIGEMNRRYGLFEQMSRAGTYVVNLDDYNAHVEKKEDRLPKIVIIIDELADLMLAAKKEVEDRIQNLTQKARAAGIHMIVATQRPSTDVITGVIKSNLSTRIAFAVATDVDSRVILDQSGAQNLLGKGDFVYTMQGINTPVRVQSAFISPEDSQRVVGFIKANNEAYFDESAASFINNTGGDGGKSSFGGGDEIEPVYIEALRQVIMSNSASISLIQRKCSVGYNKAGKIVEWMEDMGYISRFDGAKARKVLISKEEFESKYGSR